MPQEAYLGLDVGGTGAKAGVFDGHGHLLGMSRRSYQPQVTEEGRVEIPIETIYAATREAAVSAIRESRTRVVALSISSQGQTFVSLDEHDEPLHPAIVWYDARASKQAKRLARTLQSANLHETAPFVTPLATGPKVMWLHEHFPALMGRAKRYLLLPDYLAYRLTGRAVTDPCTASSTGLYAEDAPDYCAAALAAAGINKSEVAEIANSGRPIAKVLKEYAAQWELDPQTLLVTGANDQYAGALGAGNCRAGIVSVTTGTCLALVTLTERLPQPLPPGLLGGRFLIPRYQYALAFSKTAGVVLEWFNRELSPGQSLSDLDAMAEQVPVGSRGIVMLPHFDGMISPVPDPGARGAFLNLSLHHTRADMFRAALEGLGYTLCENMDFFRRCGFPIEAVRAIGGGAKSDVWLQMMADITGLPIERPDIVESALLGAAIIAAVGFGAFTSLGECNEALYRVERIFTPQADSHALYEKLFGNYVGLYRHVYHH
ncbi:MAG: xylulokinase [Terriglobia bacterium]